MKSSSIEKGWGMGKTEGKETNEAGGKMRGTVERS